MVIELFSFRHLCRYEPYFASFRQLIIFAYFTIFDYAEMLARLTTIIFRMPRVRECCYATSYAWFYYAPSSHHFHAAAFIRAPHIFDAECRRG